MTSLATHATRQRIVRTIAEQLILAVCLENDIPMLKWEERTEDQRQRFLRLAELAVLSTDPFRRTDLRERAVEHTLDWLNGPMTEGRAASHADIITEAISQYMALETA